MRAWLFAPGSARRLAAVRIGLCAILAERLTRHIFLELAEQPAALFRPRSFMNLFDQMPAREVVLGLQGIGIVALVLAAVGWRARWTLPAGWVCAVFLGGMTTSIGKVVHNDVLPLLAAVPLLAAPTTDAWSLDARREREVDPGPHGRYGWPLRTAMVVVAGAYFFAGFAKLVNSGAAWVASDNMRWIMYAASDNQSGNAAALFVAQRPWLAHVVAAGIVGLEIGFPLALVWRRATPFFLAGAVAFSAGIWATIGLDYWTYAATVFVVFVDWPAVLARVGARRRRMRQ